MSDTPIHSQYSAGDDLAGLGRHITLQTDPGTRPSVKQSYTVREDGATASRVEFRLELDSVPKLAEHPARAQPGKQVPAMFERLGSVLDSA